jgi:Cu/Ag efflux protein CusF
LGDDKPPTQVGAAPAAPAQTRPTKQTKWPTGGKPYEGRGVVRLINLEEGWLEIDHEEIKGLMPAMQMEWSVTDRSMLKTVGVGDKVNFTVVDNNGTQFITRLAKAPDAK